MAQELSHMQALYLYAQSVLTGQHTQDQEQQHGRDTVFGSDLGYQDSHEHKQRYEQYQVARRKVDVKNGKWYQHLYFGNFLVNVSTLWPSVRS